MTSPAAAAATMNWLTTSDIASALVGAGFGEVYGTMGSTQMLAVRSLAVSILARMMSQSTTLTTAIPSLNADQKNQLIVGVLSGVIERCIYRHQYRSHWNRSVETFEIRRQIIDRWINCVIYVFCSIYYKTHSRYIMQDLLSMWQ